MDGDRFDALTKAITAPSRRNLFRFLTGTLLVPAGLKARGAGAAADCIEGGAPCDPVILCCSEKCVNDRCLLDPGQQCKRNKECGSKTCKVVKKTRKGKKKECFCDDGRRSCSGLCCDPNQACERNEEPTPACLPKTGREPGQACSNGSQCDTNICKGNVCRCDDGRKTCGVLDACCAANETCQDQGVAGFQCV